MAQHLRRGAREVTALQQSVAEPRRLEESLQRPALAHDTRHGASLSTELLIGVDEDRESHGCVGCGIAAPSVATDQEALVTRGGCRNCLGASPTPRPGVKRPVLMPRSRSGEALEAPAEAAPARGARRQRRD